MGLQFLRRQSMGLQSLRLQSLVRQSMGQQAQNWHLPGSATTSPLSAAIGDVGPV